MATRNRIIVMAIITVTFIVIGSYANNISKGEWFDYLALASLVGSWLVLLINPRSLLGLCLFGAGMSLWVWLRLNQPEITGLFLFITVLGVVVGRISNRVKKSDN